MVWLKMSLLSYITEDETKAKETQGENYFQAKDNDECQQQCPLD
jgi:hypothetical protein